MNARLLLCIVLLACNPGPRARVTRTPEGLPTHHARALAAVYNAALEHLIVRAELGSIAISGKTVPFQAHVDSTSNLEGGSQIPAWRVRGETWDDFQAQNHDAQLLAIRFQLSIPTVVIDTPFVRFNYGGVRRGYLVDYPDVDGLVFLSGVGMNRSFTEAMVAVTLDCGLRCDYTEFLRLVKQRRQWTVAEELLKRWS